jgi:hypothetical protein
VAARLKVQPATQQIHVNEKKDLAAALQVFFAAGVFN